jgi:hypothetical protein
MLTVAGRLVGGMEKTLPSEAKQRAARITARANMTGLDTVIPSARPIMTGTNEIAIPKAKEAKTFPAIMVSNLTGQDIRRADATLEGRLPNYDYPVDTRKKFIMENGWFNTGRSFIKAILCLLAARRPRSFLDNAEVNISNDWLKQANSRNYHHFFPRAYLKRQGEDDYWANHIGNITLVDEFLNKREIRDKKPSVYMRNFQRQNPDLTRAMRTHLIGLDEFGVWDDDYKRFLDQRCAAFARELSSKVIRRDIDERGQVPTFDDFEEIEVAERETVETA